MQERYVVTGMTCERCVKAVTTEIYELDGVTAVDVNLTGGGAAVTSARPLDRSDVRAAAEEAG